MESGKLWADPAAMAVTPASSAGNSKNRKADQRWFANIDTSGETLHFPGACIPVLDSKPLGNSPKQSGFLGVQLQRTTRRWDNHAAQRAGSGNWPDGCGSHRRRRVPQFGAEG